MGILRSLPTIEMVTTGNELLDGTISDTNSQTLASVLKPLGLSLSRVTIVPDDRASIAQVVSEAASRARFVFVSGGLGPTTDDMTLEVSSHALGQKMIFSARAKRNVVERLRRMRRKTMNSSQFKQFYIPEGAKVLENQEGTAPGVKMTVGKTELFFLPGVPREFAYILDTHILPELKQLQSVLKEYLFVLKVFGKPESELNEVMKKIPVSEDITIGYRTYLPENHLKIQICARSYLLAERKAKILISKIQQKLGMKVFSWVEHSFEQEIFQRLLRKRLVISVAESCTGGLVSSMLTKVSGSSKVLDRSFITYSNEAKMQMIGVRPETLKKFGAVSKQTAREMALGALKHSSADRAVAVTGIAGPSGGTKQKPVGTVWIAAAHGKRVQTKCLQLSFNRELNQKYSAYEALRMLCQ